MLGAVAASVVPSGVSARASASRASESCASPFALYRATRNSWLGQAILNTMASPPRKTGNQEINGWAQSNPWMGNDHIEFYPLRTMLELKCWRSQCLLAAKDRIVGDQNDHSRLGSHCRIVVGQLNYMQFAARGESLMMVKELLQPRIEFLAIKRNFCPQ